MAYRVLVLAPRLPWPPTDGGTVAVWEPLVRMQRLGHQIDLLAPGLRSARAQSPEGIGCEEVQRPAEWVWKARAAWLTLTKAIPYMAAFDFFPAFQARLAHKVATGHYDLVQIEHARMGLYADAVLQAGLPVVMRFHNVDSELERQLAQVDRAEKRSHHDLQAYRFENFEHRLCRQVSVALAISEPDARRLAQIAQTQNIRVETAGADLLLQELPARIRKGSLLFVGSLNYPPNDDGACWLVEKIWPEIRRAAPHAHLTIAGVAPSRRLQRLAAGADVELPGYLADLRPLLQAAEVALAPLRAGSGMRLKVLEAMAAGKALVTTTLGCEGILLAHGREALVADTAQDFAASVICILANEQLRDAIGGAARSLVRTRFDWDQLALQREQLYRKLLNG